MPIEIVIPRLGWSMEEGTFAEWLKQAGDPIQPGDMVYVLEGEKAAHEVESFDAGRLCIPDDAPQPGDIVRVGQVIGFLLSEGETPPTSVCSSRSAAAPAALPQSQPSVPSVPHVAGPAARRLARKLGFDLQSIPTSDLAGRVHCDDVQRAAGGRTINAPSPSRPVRRIGTPRARRRAHELGVDWKQADGTGRDGRIRERDVVTLATRSAGQAAQEFRPTGPGRHQPTSTVRRTIAQRMLAGVQRTAPVTLTTKVGAGALVAFRAQLRSGAAGTVVPSYTDMLVKLVAAALPDCPELNACWSQGGVYIYERINIAVAVETESGLIAPVIHDAQRLTLTEIGERLRRLIEQARSGTLTQNQLQGGTFTITNLGMFDIDCFTPILNLPQSAILGVGRIVREPVIREGAVVAGETLCLSLTFDHRVIDGAPAARWLQRLGRLLQQPAGFVGDVPK